MNGSGKLTHAQLLAVCRLQLLRLQCSLLALCLSCAT